LSCSGTARTGGGGGGGVRPFFAEGPPSVLLAEGPSWPSVLTSGISAFEALIDDARRRFSRSKRADASARILAERSFGVAGTWSVGGVQKLTRSFVRRASAGFEALDLARARRSDSSAVGVLWGVEGMVARKHTAAYSQDFCGATGGDAAAQKKPNSFNY